MVLQLVQYWIFLGLALVFLYAPVLFWRGGDARLLASCLVCIGVVQFKLLAQLTYMSGLASVSLPAWYALHQLALYSIAPLLFIFVKALMGYQTSLKQWLIHFSPLPVLASLILLQFVYAEWALVVEQCVYGFSFLVGAVYAYQVKRLLSVLVQPKGVVTLEVHLLRVTTLIGILVAGVMFVGGILQSSLFAMAYGSAITALLVIGHFIHVAYPSIDQVLADEMEDARNLQEPTATAEPTRKSQLQGVDIEKSLADIERLMTKEQFYKRLDLTLPLLADHLGITPHQLSELINTKMGINFPRFLKNYRLAEARRLLTQSPELSVLDIGLAVGFSSLSAFYAAFREVDGIAPGQFRKNHAVN